MAQSGNEPKSMLNPDRIVAILSILGMLITGGYSAASYTFKTDAAERSMTELKLTIAEADKARNAQYAEIMRRVEMVPLQGERLAQLGARVDSLAQALAAHDLRINTLEARSAVNTDAIASIRAASSVRLK